MTKKSGFEISLVQEKKREAAQEIWSKESIETEIECPRCKDVMTLFSTFDSLSYACDYCGFCLFTKTD